MGKFKLCFQTEFKFLALKRDPDQYHSQGGIKFATQISTLPNFIYYQHFYSLRIQANNIYIKLLMTKNCNQKYNSLKFNLRSCSNNYFKLKSNLFYIDKWLQLLNLSYFKKKVVKTQNQERSKQIQVHKQFAWLPN